MKVKKNYDLQNSKVWSLNFSSAKFLERTRLLLPVLRSRLGVPSLGLAVLIAVEYVMRSEVQEDFMTFYKERYGSKAVENDGRKEG